MKRTCLTAVAVFSMLTCVLTANAQAEPDGRDVLESVRSAMESGDVEGLIHHAGERVDLTIFGTSELLSRSQALYVLKSFFGQYPPLNARLLETSESDDNFFASVDFIHEAGTEAISVYVRLRHVDARWELREIRFDRPIAE